MHSVKYTLIYLAFDWYWLVTSDQQYAVLEVQTEAGGWEQGWQWSQTQTCNTDSWQETKTQSRRGYWCCHRTLFFVSLRVPSPTLQPPQAPWVLQKVWDWNRSADRGGRTLVLLHCFFFVLFFFSLQPFATFAQVWITITGLKRDRTGEPQRYFLSADHEGSP